LFNSVAGYRSIRLTSRRDGSLYPQPDSTQRQTAELIDLPVPIHDCLTPAESATRDFLLQEGIDTVINVIDASVLSRSLELTLQLVELGCRWWSV
jgi:ferrous iron transport protein B